MFSHEREGGRERGSIGTAMVEKIEHKRQMTDFVLIVFQKTSLNGENITKVCAFDNPVKAVVFDS